MFEGKHYINLSNYHCILHNHGITMFLMVVKKPNVDEKNVLSHETGPQQYLTEFLNKFLTEFFVKLYILFFGWFFQWDLSEFV